MTIFLQALISGLGIGSVYAIIAVSFVVIFRATGVLNFAQPALLILGTFTASVLAVDAGLPFFVAVPLAMIIIGLLAAGVERIAIRPMVGRPVFATAIMTIGIFIALLILAFRLFDSRPRTVGDPWQLASLCLGGDSSAGGCAGGVLVYQYTIGRIVIAAIVLGALVWWLSRSRLGLAMRATSLDQEVALAQGVHVGRVFSIAWALGGGLAALGGVLLAANGGVVQATDALFSLVVLPAIIIGGIDSLRGAIIGGLVVGLVASLTSAYQPIHAPWLGPNFENVAPYLVMIIVLLLRPYGLFGTKEVQRL